jgi:hypothetical protein
MRANISIFSVIRNTGLLFLGMILALGIVLFLPDPSFSQEKKQDKLIRFSAYAQFWARYTMMNTGSRINESRVANTADLSLRNLNLFVKGQLGSLDYRLIIAKPNLSAYVKWQFFEKESNVSPISAGTYLGKKKMLAIGIGAEYKKDLLLNLNSGDTVLNSMKLFSADVFFDTPLNKEIGTPLNIYAAAFLHDNGAGYIRNLGINSFSMPEQTNLYYSGNST